MDVGTLGLAFSVLPWKEGRKAEIWGQYCLEKVVSLSASESNDVKKISSDIQYLRKEADSLGACLVLPDEPNATIFQNGLPYPVALWVRGTLPPPTKCVAVVGSRATTEAGRRRAFIMGRELTGAGIGVISGLARGIDTAAHLGSLESGQTWGVLGSGLANPYPFENISLMNRMVKSGGGVITCFPPDAKPNKWHFPRRNLLMAAWTEGVVVIEAKLKSGSLITAKLALDLGKEVWAIPGTPEDQFSEGTNAMLREGSARLVRNAKDVLDDLEFDGAWRIGGRE
ncbi:MAG: DNA-protecting protein DprA [Holophagaceae bacterium]|nr:DNA-protecting protein DprA [Holophagaceae bacterium]